MTSNHTHDTPNPYHENDRTDGQNQALEERVNKIEALLLAKGIVAKDALEKLADIYENDLGPMNGARVVARAWTDDAFKQRTPNLVDRLYGAAAIHLKLALVMPWISGGSQLSKRLIA